MRLRSLLVHRTLSERMAASGTDPGGHPAPGGWEERRNCMPCLLAPVRVERVTAAGLRQVTIAELKVMSDADIQIGDRLQNVTDRRGQELLSGPLDVITDQQRIGYRVLGIRKS